MNAAIEAPPRPARYPSARSTTARSATAVEWSCGRLAIDAEAEQDFVRTLSIGLGRALMQRLLRHAARHGVVRLVADMLPGNTALARLAASFGGRFGASPHGPGVRRALFELGGAA